MGGGETISLPWGGSINSELSWSDKKIIVTWSVATRSRSPPFAIVATATLPPSLVLTWKLGRGEHWAEVELLTSHLYPWPRQASSCNLMAQSALTSRGNSFNTMILTGIWQECILNMMTNPVEELDPARDKSPSKGKDQFIHLTGICVLELGRVLILNISFHNSPPPWHSGNSSPASLGS